MKEPVSLFWVARRPSGACALARRDTYGAYTTYLRTAPLSLTVVHLICVAKQELQVCWSCRYIDLLHRKLRISTGIANTVTWLETV